MALMDDSENWVNRAVVRLPRDPHARSYFLQVARGQALVARVNDPGSLAVMQDAFEHIMRYKCEQEGSLLWCRN